MHNLSSEKGSELPGCTWDLTGSKVTRVVRCTNPLWYMLTYENESESRFQLDNNDNDIEKVNSSFEKFLSGRKRDCCL